MELWILRHGDASWQAKSDALRPLSEQGIADNTALAAALKASGQTCDYIIHSPYLRAVQTAGQIGPAVGLGESEAWFESEYLCPDTPLAQSLDFISHFIEEHTCERLLVVGHNPLFSALATGLLDQPVSLGTSNVCQLRFESVFAPACADLLGLRFAPTFALTRF